MDELELTLEDERRENPRPLALPPGLSLKLDFVVTPLIRGLTHPLRGLFLLILLTISSTIWVVWTIENRMTPLQSYHESVRNESLLITEIAALKEAHNELQRNRLEGEISAAFERILPNYTALASWLHERATDALAAGLKFEYQLSAPQTISELAQILRVPVAIVLKINVQSADKDGYQRLLDYLYDLDQDKWTKEVRSATMSAESGSARVLEVSVDIWMRDDGDPTGPIGRPGSGITTSDPIADNLITR